MTNKMTSQIFKIALLFTVVSTISGQSGMQPVSFNANNLVLIENMDAKLCSSSTDCGEGFACSFENIEDKTGICKERHTIRACRVDSRTYQEGEKFKKGQSTCQMEECQCLSGHVICKPLCTSKTPLKIPKRPKNCRYSKKYFFKTNNKNCCSPGYEWRCIVPLVNKKSVISDEKILVSLNTSAMAKHYRSDAYPPRIRSTTKGKGAYRRKLLKKKQALHKKNNRQMNKKQNRLKYLHLKNKKHLNRRKKNFRNYSGKRRYPGKDKRRQPKFGAKNLTFISRLKQLRRGSTQYRRKINKNIINRNMQRKRKVKKHSL